MPLFNFRIGYTYYGHYTVEAPDETLAMGAAEAQLMEEVNENISDMDIDMEDTPEPFDGYYLKVNEAGEIIQRGEDDEQEDEEEDEEEEEDEAEEDAEEVQISA